MIVFAISRVTIFKAVLKGLFTDIWYLERRPGSWGRPTNSVHYQKNSAAKDFEQKLGANTSDISDIVTLMVIGTLGKMYLCTSWPISCYSKFAPLKIHPSKACTLSPWQLLWNKFRGISQPPYRLYIFIMYDGNLILDQLQGLDQSALPECLYNTLRSIL